ncbi:MAG: L-histidine N(alpha)-methyltransferase, partial [Gammaproteobacteria bacterium]|nr:L-histidine N(alpha)-methyltransferase [Gammaproteobacteria bacterium]
VESTDKVAFFPGSTIGNFLPEQAVAVLEEIKNMVGENGGLLIGVDLQKSTKILNAAYNDKQGYTAQFNLNLLSRINRELGADFNLDKFRHHAFFNEERSRIEMHLLSLQDQQVTIDGQIFNFKKDQSILTEYSHKYTIEHFQSLAEKAGFSRVKTWVDNEGLFSMHYLTC